MPNLLPNSPLLPTPPPPHPTTPPTDNYLPLTAPPPLPAAAAVTTYHLTYHLPLTTRRLAPPGQGSRCEEDNNAFWSAAAALLPHDLIEKRQARAAGRILGLNYQQERLPAPLPL